MFTILYLLGWPFVEVYKWTIGLPDIVGLLIKDHGDTFIDVKIAKHQT